MKKYTFLIIDVTDEFELPVACCDDIKQCAEWLEMDYYSTKNAVCYDLLIHGRFRIEKVINIE